MTPYSKKHRFVGHELQLVEEPQSVCGDVVPSLESGKPKDRVSRITERENSTGATRVCDWRDGAKPICSGGASRRRGRSDNAPLICNHTTVLEMLLHNDIL